MTSTLPNVPLWPRAGRSGSSWAALLSSSVAASCAESPSTVAAGASSCRRKPSGRRSAIGDLRGLVHRPEALHAGDDAAFAVVQPLLDVGREQEPSPGRSNAEGDRDRVLGLMADGDGDPAHPELLRALCGAAVEADVGLPRGQALDLD